MKQIFPFCFFLILLISCSASKKETVLTPPGKEFVSFCSHVISKDWSSDTSRLVSKMLYGELRYKSINWMDGQPFYPISLKESRIKHYFTSSVQSKGYEAFNQVKIIWGYFYYKHEQDGMFPDGIIEEWHFATAAEANKALDGFRSIGTEVFFNTQPYACVVDNKLYLFHTRAMAFSYDQKPIFEEFVKRNRAKI